MVGADREARARRMDKPMKPQVVAWELGKRLRGRCHRELRQRHHRHLVGAPDSRQARPDVLASPGNLATMAPGLPYTIAAQLAYPDRQCVAFVGDGGFSMLMADFATAVKYKLPIKVVDHQEQHAGTDQVGADGVPRQSGVRRATSAHRLRRLRARLRGSRLHTSNDPKHCGAR